MRYQNGHVLVAGLVGCLLAACASPEPPAPPRGQTGQLRLLLTDAPLAGVDAVNVTISRIEVHHADIGWMLFSDTPQTFDLLALHDLSAALGLADLPVGEYNQIRLILTDAEVVIDGVAEPLVCGSCGNSGLKLVHNFTIAPDTVTTLLLDFDAAESVHQAGDKYILHPVIKITDVVTPDVTPPTIVVANVENPSGTGGVILAGDDEVTLIGTVKDNRILASFTITVNGTDVYSPPVASDGSFTEDIIIDTSETQVYTSNTVVLVATDAAGNTTTLTVEVRFVAQAVPGELLIRFNPDSTEGDRLAAIAGLGATLVQRIMANLYLVRLPTGMSQESAILVLAAPNPLVTLAMPNSLMLVSAHTAATTSNDTLFAQMVQLDDGTPSGATDADIDAPEAWDTSVGSQSIVVAVLDTGIFYDHEDLIDPDADTDCDTIGDAGLVDNVWLNEDECCLAPPCASLCLPKRPLGDPDECPRSDLNSDGCPGTCGTDDDGDGYADFADPDVRRWYSNGVDDDGDGMIDEQGPAGAACDTVASIPAGVPAGEDCEGVANDDDENGYPDDCRGWDFSNRAAGLMNDNDPDSTDASFNDHGTHVSGTVGAIGNNCKGVTGVSHRVKVMPIKVMRNGSVDLAGALAAFAYAADNGAMVTNSSWSRRCTPGELPSTRCPWGSAFTTADAAELYTQLMKETHSEQVLHVFAAGNNTENLDTTTNFYYVQQARIPNKLLVAATANDDTMASFSNFGFETVALAAPGVDVCSTIPANVYSCTYDGTSMASPHTAGLAGLILSTNPALIGDPTRLARHLAATVETGTDLGTDNSLLGAVASEGRINANNAMTAALPPVTLFIDSTATSLPGGITLTTYDVDLFDMDGDADLDMLDLPCHVEALTDQIHLLENDGTGVFTDVTAAQWPTEGTSQCGGDHGDVDGDGDQDVVVAGFSNFDLAERETGLFLNDSAGTFTRDATGKIPPNTLNSRDVDLCDLDGDGDLDLYVSNAGSAPNDVLYTNDGTGTFTDETVARIGAVDTSGSTHNTVCVELTQTLFAVCNDEDALICPVCADPHRSVADLVANGLVPPSKQADCLGIRAEVKPELLLVEGDGDATKYLVNDGTGVFSDGTAAAGIPSSASDHDADVFDADGDGDLDIVIGRRANLQDAILINDGTAVFTDETVTRFPLMVDNTSEVDVGDFDVDGDLDIVLGNGDPNVASAQVSIYLENDGNGNFINATATSGFSGVIHTTTDVEPGDVDGDGDLDLVIGNWGEPNELLSNKVVP